ncbi:MAG TPA: FecR family protein [Polyangiaceae bacterium]|nr:FecR family protein [Polyangiaceae bacterium]
MTQDPSRYVQPDVTEARVNRLWLGVADRLEKRPARVLRWVVVCTALSGAAAGAFLLTRGVASPAASTGGERALLADAKLETGGDTLAVTLGDGSSVKLASESALQVRGNRSTSVSLALGHGEVTCDVTHREGRKFSVVAGDVEVRVVGTKFSVKTTAGDEPRVEVSVLRGVVEVASRRRPGIVARVAAGQSWIQTAGNVAREAALEPPSTAPQPDGVAATPNDAVLPNDAAPKMEPQSSVSPPPSAAPAGPSARELFEKAGESRRAGDAAAAAHAYEELLRLHPTDGRASLSAFELGRLRMDRLGDPAGAITALERAVALHIGPSFREDALARLVSVYASQGNFAACERARERYLSSYPAGVHAAAVATRCGSR